MKITIKTLILAAIATLAVGLWLGWFFFGAPDATTDEQHRHDTASETTTQWTCAMHPQIRSNESGACPICGMELIPVDQHEGHENVMAVRMSPMAMKLAEVSTLRLGDMRPVKSIRLNGKIQIDERQVFSQSSHISGRVERLQINYTGEYIAQGQAMAAIYSPELVTAQEELMEAMRMKDSQPDLYLAARGKLKNWKLTDTQIDQLMAGGQVREEFPIHADRSGYVMEKKVNRGDYIKKGQSIYEMAGLSQVWVLFDLYESDLPWVKKGDAITFTVASLPGEIFEGKITYIDPVIDAKSRVAKARVELANKDFKLKPEMFVSGVVEAALPVTSKAIIVPKSAVMWTGERSVVYVKNMAAQGVAFELREVRLGAALGDSYLIEEGLTGDEEIAVHGTFSIDAAAQLAGQPSMMNPTGGKAMTGHDHGMQKTEEAETPLPDRKAVVSKEARQEVASLLASYFTLKDALVEDDFGASQQAALRLQTQLNEISPTRFEGQSLAVWKRHGQQAIEALTHVAHFQDIEAIRKSFLTVSRAMIGLADAFVPLSQTLYIQHCPMASNNQGANWLSLSEEIKNPYFGAAMLTCGGVTDSIKAGQ